MLIFAVQPGESIGSRVARIAREAASQGPMGCWLQRERYAAFLDVWDMSDDYSRLIDKMHAGAVLAGVRTSCAVDASCVLRYSRWRNPPPPWHADGSWGITSWLGLGFDHPAWTDAAPDIVPSEGDLFYRGAKTSALGHVGIVVGRTPDGAWLTFEGGGSPHADEIRGLTQQQILQINGTVCRMTPPQGKDIFAPDSLGRHLTGWWKIEEIGLPTTEEILEGKFARNG